MITFSTKTLLIAGGLTSVGVASAGAIYLTTSNKDKFDKQVSDSSAGKAEKQTKDTKEPTANQKISSLLTNKTLLTKENLNDPKWQEQWNAFKQEYDSRIPPAPWNFSNWEQNKGLDETINSFKDQCDTLGKKEVTGKSDTVYIAVERYCTKAESS